MKRVIVFLLISMLGAVSALAADQAMTGEDLTKLLAKGKVLTLGGPGKGYSGSLTLGSNGVGKGSAKTDAGKTIDLAGPWEIVGDQFCRVWSGSGSSGKQVCETWIKTGKRSVDVVVDGKVIGFNSW